MPGWHDATTELRRNGLQTVGVVVEQHPDRARLFMQWKQLEWPLLWDPFNLLELPAVPITSLLDPEGRIRLVQPRLDAVAGIGSLIAADGHAGSDGVRIPSPVPGPAATTPPGDDDPDRWSDHAVALALWAGIDSLDAAIDASGRAVSDAAEGRLWFRHGVLLRMRHDSPARRHGDFVDATDAWTRALSIDPNNYIWRRRLQQYGPRQAKPYAFYDWIPVARREITESGSDPVDLDVEPEGAEFAEPADPVSATDVETPLPDRRITTDDGHIDVRVGVVPARVRPGDGVRIHLDMAPAADGAAHWNNEAGPLELWVQPPPGWTADALHHEVDVPGEPTSDEVRHLEFELRAPPTAPSGPVDVTVVALYAICEDDTGVCLIRRRAIDVPVRVDAGVVGLGDG